MNVLITGVSGYIGYHLALKYIQEGNHVIGTYNTPCENKIKVLQEMGVELVKIDLANTPLQLDKHIDITIHCAALKGIVNGNHNPEQFYKTNINALLNTYKVASSIFVLISTGIAERSDSPYAKSKLMCEKVLEDLCNKSKSKGVVLRYYNPLGTKHPLFIDKDNVLHTLYKCYKTGASFTVFGDSVRDFIPIQDLMNLTYETLNNIDSDFSIKELGTGIATSVMSFIKTFEDCVNTSVIKEKNFIRENDVAWSVARCRYNPRQTLQEVINDYVNLNL